MFYNYKLLDVCGSSRKEHVVSVYDTQSWLRFASWNSYWTVLLDYLLIW